MTEKISDEAVQKRLRELPSVGRLLESSILVELRQQIPLAVITHAARETIDTARKAIAVGNNGVFTLETLAEQVIKAAKQAVMPSLSPAINATGIVLHTGLGRARLAQTAVTAINEVAASHSLVEIEAETGKRGSRQDHVRGLLTELTGAEDVAVVNNCAGAVYLAVSVLASGREVIISRGELVEIGGAFRIPDIIKASGATLVEVGTTNRTRIRDYAEAITERTGLILRCHPSNFAVVGFTEEAPTTELVALGRDHGIPVMDDQGSGALTDLSRFGVKGWGGSLLDSVKAGSDLITASGDKLMGATQVGILLGNREIIARCRTHPLARILRVDKLTLAGLEATLRLYRDPETIFVKIPTLKYLSRTETELSELAEQLAKAMKAVLPLERFFIRLVPEQSQVGGGSLPGENLPTICVALSALDDSFSPDAIAAHLRRHTPAIFARIRDDSVLFDPRTLETEEAKEIAHAVKTLAEL